MAVLVRVNPEGHFASRLIADEVRSNSSRLDRLRFAVQVHAVPAQPRVPSAPTWFLSQPLHAILSRQRSQSSLFLAYPHQRFIKSSYGPLPNLLLGVLLFRPSLFFEGRSVRTELVTCMFSEPYAVAAKIAKAS